MNHFAVNLKQTQRCKSTIRRNRNLQSTLVSDMRVQKVFPYKQSLRGGENCCSCFTVGTLSLREVAWPEQQHNKPVKAEPKLQSSSI